MNDTLQTLMNNIVANPDDLTARLVYADALEESGDPVTAQFIREHIRGKFAEYANLELFKSKYPLPSLFSGFRRIANSRYSNDYTPERSFVIKNGLPEVIVCPIDFWFFFSDEILQRYPITHVVFDRSSRDYARERLATQQFNMLRAFLCQYVLLPLWPVVPQEAIYEIRIGYSYDAVQEIEDRVGDDGETIRNALIADVADCFVPRDCTVAIPSPRTTPPTYVYSRRFRDSIGEEFGNRMYRIATAGGV